MQQVITAIAQKHDIDLQTVPVGSSLRLDMPHFDRLVIEKIAPKQISVAHYFEQNGDLVADPDIVFFLDDAGWIPIGITQVFGYQRVAFLRPDGTRMIAALPDDQLAVAIFADDWAANLEAQNWLTDGTVTRRRIEPTERAA
jgi:hypothetical protein